MQRPEASEYDSYYATYIDQVPDGDILEILRRGVQETDALLRGVPAEWGRYRYAEGKWTIGEVIGHIIDAEWIFSYRALCMARGDTADLAAMDQDLYGEMSNAAERPLDSLLGELVALRGASLALFTGLDAAAHLRRGRASGCPFTVRTFPWILAGHEIHHRKVLVERYLAPLRATG